MTIMSQPQSRKLAIVPPSMMTIFSTTATPNGSHESSQLGEISNFPIASSAFPISIPSALQPSPSPPPPSPPPTAQASILSKKRIRLSKAQTKSLVHACLGLKHVYGRIPKGKFWDMVTKEVRNSINLEFKNSRDKMDNLVKKRKAQRDRGYVESLNENINLASSLNQLLDNWLVVVRNEEQRQQEINKRQQEVHDRRQEIYKRRQEIHSKEEADPQLDKEAQRAQEDAVRTLSGKRRRHSLSCSDSEAEDTETSIDIQQTTRKGRRRTIRQTPQRQRDSLHRLADVIQELATENDSSTIREFTAFKKATEKTLAKIQSDITDLVILNAEVIRELRKNYPS